MLGRDSDGDGAENVCLMQIKKEKGKVTFKIIYAGNRTFKVCARFSVGACKRNERGDSNHTIYFKWPYLYSLLKGLVRQWQDSAHLLGNLSCNAW